MTQSVLFSQEEVNQIIEDALNSEWKVSKVYTNEQGEAAEVSKFRKSHHTLIDYNSDSFYYKKVSEFLSKNDITLNIPSIEVMVIRYDEGDYINKHIDKMERYSRRYAMITQLTEADKYEGGELVFYDRFTKEPDITDPTPGNSILYPVDIEHEVKELTSGTRYSAIIFLCEEEILQKRSVI